MNVFGDDRRYGIPGPEGRDAFDLTGWTPNALLRIFREDTECSFYFKTETDCIWYNKKDNQLAC